MPAHDVESIDVMCEYLSTQWIDALVQEGDFFDFESISSFAKENPRALANGDMYAEIEIGRRVFTRILKAARTKNPDCLFYYGQGNHETRLLKFIDRQPMWRGFDLQKEIGLEQLGGIWVPFDSDGAVLRFEQIPGRGIVPIVRLPTERAHVYYHGLSIVHGWSYSMHSAKSHADLAPWPGLVVYGHVHTAQLYTRRVWGLDKPWAMTTGWLGLPWPGYTMGHPNGWVTAFGMVYLDKQCPGHIDGHPIRIVDRRLIGPAGKIITGRRAA